MGRLRLSPRAYQWVTLVAAILLALIIVTGAAVRLTGSGLGCPEWPNCTKGSFASSSSDFHTTVEFANRVVTGLVSFAVIVAVLGSLVRLPRRQDLIWLSLGLVVGVIAQALLGALVVEELLDPPFVMGHFLLSAVLLADAIVLHHRAGLPDGSRSRPAFGPGADLDGSAARARGVRRARDRDRRDRSGPALRGRGFRREPQGHAARSRRPRGRAHPRDERDGVPRPRADRPVRDVTRDRPAPGPRAGPARDPAGPRDRPGRARATTSTSTACRAWPWGSMSPERPRSSAPRSSCCSRCTSRYGPARVWRSRPASTTSCPHPPPAPHRCPTTPAPAAPTPAGTGGHGRAGGTVPGPITLSPRSTHTRQKADKGACHPPVRATSVL